MYIEGFKIACLDPHPKYGTAIYVREDILDYSVTTPIKVQATSIIGITVGCVNIYNTYKPPGTSWPIGTLRAIPKPSLIVGDFNSHNTTWGYSTVDEAGEVLEEWIACQDLHLIQDLKGPCTFWSARWNAGYNPDLTLVTLDNDGHPLPAGRTVIGDFPNSQHRFLLIKVGFNLHAYKSLPNIRWNFKKANWQGFQNYVEEIVNRIPKAPSSIDRFTGLLIKSAKKNIPRGYRKTYVPGWDEQSENLFLEYQKNPNTELGKSLGVTR